MKDVNMAAFSDEQGKIHGDFEMTPAEPSGSFEFEGNELVRNLKEK